MQVSRSSNALTGGTLAEGQLYSLSEPELSEGARAVVRRHGGWTMFMFYHRYKSNDPDDVESARQHAERLASEIYDRIY